MLTNENQPATCEIAVAMALPPVDADRVDLLSDLHPKEKRWLRESDETLPAVLPYLRFLRRDLLDENGTLAPWLEYFPELRDIPPASDFDGLTSALWKRALSSATILRLAYAVRPGRLDARVLAEVRRHEAAMNERVRKWSDVIGAATTARGMSFISQRFPLRSHPGAFIDCRSGFAARLVGDLGLAADERGLLFGYLDARGDAIEAAVSPRAFEAIAAQMFEADGWTVELTRASRDGGKDVVARRVENGRAVVSYVQAKRYRGPVDIAAVKEFVATLGGDGIEHGYVITTSRASRDATRWAEMKGRRIATVEFIEGPEVRRRIHAIARRTSGVFDSSAP